MSSQRAVNLREAYRVSDVKPLEGDDLDRYYTELGESRKSEAVTNMRVALDLQESGEFSTILFTGHRGCGKSTELHSLERNLRKQYHVIYLRTDEITDINDVEYTDLYLLVAQYVEYELRKTKIKIDASIIRDFESWFAEVTHENEQTVESSISVEGEITLGGETPFPIPFLAKLLAKIMSQIKGGSKDKQTIRQTLERDFSRLKTTLNLLLDDGNEKLRKRYPDKKGILLIFDNLDRCPPHVAERLFFNYGSQLQELRCTIIYTLPISALYSPRGIANTFAEPKIIPMVNIYEFDAKRNPLKHNPDGIQALVNLLERRMDTQQIFATDRERDDLIRASGGHIRHLMQMVREACLTAIGRGHSKIEADDVVYAINQRQFSFEREIPDTHYGAIANTYRTKRANNDEIGQLTLVNTSVLEYNGKRRWNYPHPTVLNIDAFQRALNDSVQ
ncbi:P-loop NTPase fold protein [Pseudanabaena sp. PCC 6802]|uniref:P-loop NTPase fold protein n=1 Tax=Pseudanabaena sp. PCC 6802 TaxID=118173 RepID=UPI00034AA9BA|nr:P-loop NTPase fold protein [Pseudanabaena sp. PCC 6802]